MKTNSTPYSDQPPGATPDNTRVANFQANDNLANGYDDGYAATGSSSYFNAQNYLTDVGAYALSSSYYGTFDQNGNVWEWNESALSSSTRGDRGGAWTKVSSSMYYRDNVPPTTEASSLGFRVASSNVPEPSTVALSVVALATLPTRRRKSVPHNRV